MRPKPGGGGAVSMEGDAEPEIEDVVLVACIDRRPALLQVSIAAPVEVGDRRERDVPADPDVIPRADHEPEPVRCRGAGVADSEVGVAHAALGKEPPLRRETEVGPGPPDDEPR